MLIFYKILYLFYKILTAINKKQQTTNRLIITNNLTKTLTLTKI